MVAKLKVRFLVHTFPGYDPVGATSLLTEAKIAESRRLGGLGVRQHDALLNTGGA